MDVGTRRAHRDAGLAAISFRVAGLPLLPAVALHATGAPTEVGKLAVVPVLVWCLCGAVAVAVSPSSITYTELLPRDPAAVARTVVENVRPYPFLALNLFLYPFPWYWWGNDVYHVVICGFAVLGAIRVAPTPAEQFLPRLCGVLPRHAVRHADSARTLPDAACAGGTVLRRSWDRNARRVGSAPNETSSFRGARSPCVTRRQSRPSWRLRSSLR